MTNVLLIDASMVYAANAAKNGHLRTSKGYPTGAVYGLTRSIESNINAFSIDKAYICMDVGGTERKRGSDPSYKSGRDPNGVALWRVEDLPVLGTPISEHAVQRVDHKADVHEWAWARGVHRAWREGYEADQVIHSLWEEAREAGCTVFILSKDHDMRAMLDDGTHIVWSGKEHSTPQGSLPHGPLYPMYLALFGDPTDAVKPAVRDSAEARGIWAGIEQAKDPMAFLMDGMKRADAAKFVRNYQLTKLDMPGNAKVVEGRMNDDRLREWAERLEMNSVVKKIEEEAYRNLLRANMWTTPEEDA